MEPPASTDRILEFAKSEAVVPPAPRSVAPAGKKAIVFATIGAGVGAAVAGGPGAFVGGGLGWAVDAIRRRLSKR
jgi:hypothetical protein